MSESKTFVDQIDAVTIRMLGHDYAALPASRLIAAAADAKVEELEGQVQALAAYKNAVEDYAITNNTFRNDATPEQLIQEAVMWDIHVALDPLVSEKAARLRDTYLAERDQLRIIADKLPETRDRVKVFLRDTVWIPGEHTPLQVGYGENGTARGYWHAWRPGRLSVDLNRCYSTKEAAALAAKEVGRG
jgi:hypothetical protein